MTYHLCGHRSSLDTRERMQILGSNGNTCDAPSHQRTPLLLSQEFFGRRGVISRGGLLTVLDFDAPPDFPISMHALLQSGQVSW